MASVLTLYKVSVYGVSDVGLVRNNNEDFWSQLSDDRLYILADGMGGHQAGEIASRAAADYLSLIFKEKWDLSSKSLPKAKQILGDAIDEVNHLIYKMGIDNPSCKGMGTTLCVLFFHPKALIYAHVGDSRIYRLRHRELTQLTQDHSLMRELIEMGRLKEEQAEGFLYKNIITKAIGTENQVQPTFDQSDILPGDVLMMCSDGLTDMLNNKEIEKILLTSPESEAVFNLVDEAKNRGGLDNITVVLIFVHETAL